MKILLPDDFVRSLIGEQRSHSPRSGMRQRDEDTLSLAGTEGELKPRSFTMMPRKTADDLSLHKSMKEKKSQPRGAHCTFILLLLFSYRSFSFPGSSIFLLPLLFIFWFSFLS